MSQHPPLPSEPGLGLPHDASIPLRNMTSEQLAALAACGTGTGPDALGELYERLNDALFSYVVCRTSGDYAVAEDIVGDTWVKVARKVRTYTPRGDGSFAAWVTTIARRGIADHYRSAFARRERVTADMLALDAPNADLSPSGWVENRQTSELLVHALKKLTPKQRQCVTLRFFHGLSVSESAAVMGESITNVKVTQHRAIKKLASLLPREAVGYIESYTTGPNDAPVAVAVEGQEL